MQYDKNATVVDQFGTCIPERQNRKIRGICSTYIADDDRIQQTGSVTNTLRNCFRHIYTATDCKQYSKISKNIQVAFKMTSETYNYERSVFSDTVNIRWYNGQMFMHYGYLPARMCIHKTKTVVTLVCKYVHMRFDAFNFINNVD